MPVVTITRTKKPAEPTKPTQDDLPTERAIAASLEDPEETGKKRGGARGGKTKVEPTINIDLGDDIWIRADSLSWTLEYKGSRTYHPNISSLFHTLFERKLRAQKAASLQELSDRVVEVQKWLQDLLVPFCTWDGAQIHLYLADEFKQSAARVTASK